MSTSLTDLEKIKVYLSSYGIYKDVTIEQEVEKLLLNWFESDDIEDVLLDSNGGLIFEFRDSLTAPTMDGAITEIESTLKK